MHRGRSFLILLVVAAGLGAYYFLVEAGRDPMADSAKAKVFPALAPGSLEEIVVTAENGQVTRARKTGTDWAIVEPEALDADVAAVNSLASTIEGLEIQQTLADAPESLAPYGLEPPRYSVAFRAAGATDLERLEVGDRTPTGGDMYARVGGQPALLLIAGYLDDSLDKSTFDLRDKTVLHLDRDVDRVLLTPASGAPTEAVRQDNDWRLTAPVAARADFSAVDGLIRRVLQAEMKSIVSEDGADLASFGLASPRATVTLGTGSAQATLAIGNEAEAGSVYARDASRPVVFTLDSAIFDAVTPDPADLRMKDVFAFRSFNAVGLSVTIDGATHTFTKTTPPAAEGDTASPTPVWTRSAPDTGDVDQGVISGLLTSLSNLRADSFADRPLASGEEVVITARFGDAETPSEETVTFRKSGDVVHAIVPGEPGAAVVSTSAFDSAVAVIRTLTGAQ